MRFFTRLFFALMVMSFGKFAFAADYYWVYSGKSGKYPSAFQACEKSAIKEGYDGGRIGSLVTGPGFNTPTFQCFFKSGSDEVEKNHVVRSGDSCPSETIYNPATGSCEAPPKNECEEKAGESDPYSKSGDIDDGYYSVATVGGKKYGVTPNDACMGGCAVSVQANCISTISTNRYTCKGKAYYSGAACTASSETPQVEQEENYVPDEPKNIEIKEPCIYVPDAQGAMRCVSKESLEKEGQSCGEYNGQTLCVPKTATSDDKTVQTEVTEKVEPDGGKTTVKKDTATVTKCTGSNKNCTTTTTTTTTTSKSDGSGATTSTTVECKGKDCGSGTGGGGAGNGSGSGEGEEGEEGGELEGQDEVAGFGESLQDFNTRISAAPILSTVTSIAMPRGGSCSMPSANIPVIGSISFNWICENADLLDPLYYVMLAIWALFATRVFLEA